MANDEWTDKIKIEDGAVLKVDMSKYQDFVCIRAFSVAEAISAALAMVEASYIRLFVRDLYIHSKIFVWLLFCRDGLPL